MHIENRGSTAFYRFLIAALAGCGLWLELTQLGLNGLRLFSGWFLIICTIYYIVSTLTTLFWRRHDAGRAVFPRFQGALVVSGMTLLVGQIVLYALDVPNPGPSGLTGSLVYDVIPVLILMEWILFSEKGHWRLVEPLYWLALPVIYVCVILITAVMVPDLNLKYPYEFLDWPEIGIDTMLWQLAIIGVLYLAFSYLCWLIDFAMSGHLSEHVVLPRIKTIIIEEDDDTDMADEPEAAELEAVITEAADEPSAEEVAVVTKLVKVKVEGLEDQKSATKMHGTKTDAKERKPVKLVSRSGAKEIEIGDAAGDSKPKPAKAAPKPKAQITEPKVQSAGAKNSPRKLSVETKPVTGKKADQPSKAEAETVKSAKGSGRPNKSNKSTTSPKKPVAAKKVAKKPDPE